MSHYDSCYEFDANHKDDAKVTKTCNACDKHDNATPTTVGGIRVLLTGTEAENAEFLNEVQLVSIIIDNLPLLKKAGAKRVLDFAQRFYEDTFGKEDKKVYR